MFDGGATALRMPRRQRANLIAHRQGAQIAAAIHGHAGVHGASGGESIMLLEDPNRRAGRCHAATCSASIETSGCECSEFEHLTGSAGGATACNCQD